jgi:hypothetical protein
MLQLPHTAQVTRWSQSQAVLAVVVLLLHCIWVLVEAARACLLLHLLLLLPLLALLVAAARIDQVGS